MAHLIIIFFIDYRINLFLTKKMYLIVLKYTHKKSVVLFESIPLIEGDLPLPVKNRINQKSTP